MDCKIISNVTKCNEINERFAVLSVGQITEVKKLYLEGSLKPRYLVHLIGLEIPNL